MPRKDREAKNAYQREWARKNPDKVKRTSEYYKQNNLWSHHKLRLNDFEELLKLQDYACLICKTKFESRTEVHIDHDHDCPDCGDKTKSCMKCRRGLLCQNCNHLVGYIEKRVLLLPEVFDYLGWGWENISVLPKGFVMERIPNA